MTPQLAFALGFLVAIAVTVLVTLALARLMRDIVTPPTANPTLGSGAAARDEVDVGDVDGLREFFSERER